MTEALNLYIKKVITRFLWFVAGIMAGYAWCYIHFGPQISQIGRIFNERF